MVHQKRGSKSKGQFLGEFQLTGQNVSAEDLLLEDELLNLVPYVYRANSMAKELDKNVHYEIVLMPPESRELGNSVGFWH